MSKYSKVGDSIEVETTETVIKTVKYDYGFLLSQRDAILEQKAREIAQRDAELAEVELLISEADKLGIVKAESVEEVTIKVK